MQRDPNVIAFSYAKRALVQGSREYERMCEYARVFSSYHVIVFTRKEEGFPAVQTDGALTLYATNASSRIGMLVAAYRIGARIIKTERHKTFVLSGQDPFVASIVPWLLSFKKRTWLQVQVHGDIYSEYFFGDDPLRVVKKLFANIVFKRAKKVRVVSERIKRSLIKRGVPNAAISVVPVQSDMEAFFNVGEVRQDTPRDTVEFLYVGRFAPEKNVELLLRAFACAVKDVPQARLTIVGAGPLESVYKRYIKKLGLESTVTIMPWQEDIAAVMARMDVFCLASLHEGYAMVLLEALAAGLPVVTTDVGCVGEVVVDGETGVVVGDMSAAAYAAALTTIATNAAFRAQLRTHTTFVAARHIRSKEAYLQAIKHSYLIS